MANITNEYAITVLLPVFFRDSSERDLGLLRRALESVHAQRFPGAYEIIVVDDGSPRAIETQADALGTAAKSIRWIRSERNNGLVHALNRGLLAARFPFVARLDADDRWRETKLEKQFALFVEDPDLTITGTGMSRVKADGTDVDVHIRPGDWNGVLRFFVDVGCPFPHGSILARREIYHMLGGYPHDLSLRHCEDYALWGTWLRFFKPAMVEEALYEYTISPGSISTLHAGEQLSATLLTRERFRSLDVVNRLPEALREFARAIGGSVLDAGSLAYTMWRYGVAVRLPLNALDALRVMVPDRRLDLEPKTIERVFEPNVLVPRLARAKSLESSVVVAATVDSLAQEIRVPRQILRRPVSWVRRGLLGSIVSSR